VPTTFYIRAKDKYGNLRLTGGDAFHISFQGPCGTQQDTRAQVLFLELQQNCNRAITKLRHAAGHPRPVPCVCVCVCVAAASLYFITIK
jgi:hypothetical protein